MILRMLQHREPPALQPAKLLLPSHDATGPARRANELAAPFAYTDVAARSVPNTLQCSMVGRGLSQAEGSRSQLGFCSGGMEVVRWFLDCVNDAYITFNMDAAKGRTRLLAR